MRDNIHNMTFENLQLIPEILQALKKEGYLTPTPIQNKAIPLVLARHDLLGCAQTGTGKTAAFALPILQILESKKHLEQGRKRIKILIVTPTRELAIQIGESFSVYGRYLSFHTTVVFGGVKQQSQTQALRNGVDILVATPGRLLDLMGQGFITLQDIGIFVLDEADRMLDMGFIHDVKKIIARLPVTRQTLFFSATMPPAIMQLSKTILTDPIKIETTPSATTAETIHQEMYYVDKSDKVSLLVQIGRAHV
jgi:ATP-dependent RNA helicase RhlE